MRSVSGGFAAVLAAELDMGKNKKILFRGEHRGEHRGLAFRYIPNNGSNKGPGQYWEQLLGVCSGYNLGC